MMTKMTLMMATMSVMMKINLYCASSYAIQVFEVVPLKKPDFLLLISVTVLPSVTKISNTYYHNILCNTSCRSIFNLAVFFDYSGWLCL